MKKRITKDTSERRITRRELVGGALAAAGVIDRCAGLSAGPEPQQQAEHRDDRLRRPCQREHERRWRQPRRERDAQGAVRPGLPPGIPAENITVLCDVNQDAVDAAAQKFPKAKKYNDFRRVFDSPKDFDAVMVSTARAHPYPRNLPGADARQTRLLREAAHPRRLGGEADSRDRREVPEARHADGQPGPRLAGSPPDQGTDHGRRDWAGARGARLGGSRVGAAERRVGREVRQAARVLQRHPDH